MWTSVPGEARDFIAEHDIPLHVIHVARDNDYVPDQPPVVVTGVYERDTRVLFVRSSKNGRSWELPGGRVEADETIPDALTREMAEETGREVTQHEPAVAILWVFPSATVVNIVFRVALGEQMQDAVNEVSEITFFEDIPSNVSFGEEVREAYAQVIDDSVDVAFEESYIDRVRPQLTRKHLSVAVGAAAGGMVAAAAARKALMESKEALVDREWETLDAFNKE